MTETYFPFDAGAGSSITEDQWRQMAQLWRSDGPVADVLNQLNTFGDSTGLQVKVDTGNAWIHGHYYSNSALITLAIAANSSGSTRIDRVVLHADFVANTIAAFIVQGTPGSGAPPLTQSSSVWEVPLAEVTVVNGASTINPIDVVDQRSLVFAQSRSAGPQLRSYFWSYLEFLQQSVSVDVHQSAPFDHIGEWVVASSDASCACNAVATPGVSHPGVLNFDTGTVSTGRTTLNTSPINLGGGRVRYGALVRIPILATSSQRFTLEFGLCDTNNPLGTTNNEVAFVVAGDNSTGGLTGGHIHAVANNGGSRQITDLGAAYAAVATTWYLFEIDVAPDGSSAQYFLNGTLVATISTGIPSGDTEGRVVILKSVGSTARSFDIDALWLAGEFTNNR